jgi:hypothetical protein
MTPGEAWKRDYSNWPDALAKLSYCDRTVAELREHEPIQIDDELDEDVSEIGYSIAQYYESLTGEAVDLPDGLDGALRAVFDDPTIAPDAGDVERAPASTLLSRLERTLSANVFVWTGHFPEKTLVLVRHLAKRADMHALTYPVHAEASVSLALTTMVTALAMNHVHRGSYLP